MLNIGLIGSNGRMGQSVWKTFNNSDECRILFGTDKNPDMDAPFPTYTSLSECDMVADCLIDFSIASAIEEILEYAIKTKTNLVIASTGHTQEQEKLIRQASKKIAIFKASNMSLGINLLTSLAKNATKFIGNEFDIEIVETHHNKKLDAPSGTALSIATAINSCMNNSLEAAYGRHSTNERRKKNELGIHAVRGGSVIGKHDVHFFGQSESICISHEAESKEVFARGAVRAARFLSSKTNGMYDMNSIIAECYATTTVECEDKISVFNVSGSFCDFILILEKIKDADINIDMISKTDDNHVSFSCSESDGTKLQKILSKETYTIIPDLSKITIECAGMEYKSGVALEIFKIINELSPIYAITTSETKIACAVDRKVKDKIKNKLIKL